MNKIEKLYSELNANACEVFDGAMKDKFGDCGFNTEWNLFTGTLVTKWSKKIPIKLKKEIKTYLDGFSCGYCKAMDYVGNQR